MPEFDYNAVLQQPDGIFVFQTGTGTDLLCLPGWKWEALQPGEDKPEGVLVAYLQHVGGRHFPGHYAKFLGESQYGRWESVEQIERFLDWMLTSPSKEDLLPQYYEGNWKKLTLREWWEEEPQ